MTTKVITVAVMKIKKVSIMVFFVHEKSAVENPFSTYIFSALRKFPSLALTAQKQFFAQFFESLALSLRKE